MLTAYCSWRYAGVAYGDFPEGKCLREQPRTRCVGLIRYSRVVLAQGTFMGETVKSFLSVFDYLFHFDLRMNNI